VPPPTPHEVQSSALEALQLSRERGATAGLVVLATGLGKTWLAAFDSVKARGERTIFIAHREEILLQAMRTFRRIRPNASMGMFMGREKVEDSDVIFASIQTLKRDANLNRFSPDEFDYIVIDEFHHADAKTYRKVLDYFTPRFMLGLTATPERTDGGDLLALCQENLVYRCDVMEGIEKGLLCPFQYFGVPDEVDYSNIPWRSNRFSLEDLETAVITESRAQNAYDQLSEKGGKRTLAFCCSKKHADYMKDFFKDRGLRAASVHSGESSDPRALALEELSDGVLDVVFSVDMFNEGVDLPDVDTVMMLRPTESRLLWLQQFGRGLRIAEGKSHLTVIDYIGNHRSFFTKAQALFSLDSGDHFIEKILQDYQDGALELPEGCKVTYDLEVVEVLSKLVRKPRGRDELEFSYQSFQDRYGRRPTASELYHEEYLKKEVLRRSYGSWFDFVHKMGGLTEEETEVGCKGESREFLLELETTSMTKSYKMFTLLALIRAGVFPGAIRIDRLVNEVKKLATQYSVLRSELGDVVLGSDSDLSSNLIRNPINAWSGGNSNEEEAYFSWDGQRFRATFEVDPEYEGVFSEMVREIIDWRLSEYLSRRKVAKGEFRGAVRGNSYKRESIPSLFGFEFNVGSWRQGFVVKEGHIFLFVTLDKSNMNAEYHYQDRFLGEDVFEWVSQNRTTQDSKAGQSIINHEEQNAKVHLFVRKHKMHASRGAPFVYCGDVQFQSCVGDRPITVRWKLKEPLNRAEKELFYMEG
jgi:superfamily II DNA or RNA helicase